jgi:hypothetical protein
VIPSQIDELVAKLSYIDEELASPGKSLEGSVAEETKL